MAYIKTDWQDGDVISEAGLDHLETGVYNNSVAIGDLSELDTTAKANLVAAINEAAQSGGGSGGMSNAVKDALLQIASKVAYIDEDGQEYYDDLYNALYPGAMLVSIQADYTQTGTVYPTTSLDDLRNDLVVNAIYDNGSVVPVISYTLSGSLTVGESSITVTYEGETDTFDVTVSAVPTVSSISAVYTQSGTVYDTDSLDSLKTDLVVTAVWSDSTQTTVPSTDYTLSGTLAVGTSTVTVSYGGKTTTFNVTVTAAPTLASISAVYTQSGTVYDTDSLDSLKADLVVTATYSDSSTATVPSTDYTLSGTLTAGTSTITVSYESKTTTFSVTVSHDTAVTVVEYAGVSFTTINGVKNLTSRESSTSKVAAFNCTENTSYHSVDSGTHNRFRFYGAPESMDLTKTFAELQQIYGVEDANHPGTIVVPITGGIIADQTTDASIDSKSEYTINSGANKTVWIYLVSQSNSYTPNVTVSEVI